jgi:hypothetical protein
LFRDTGVGKKQKPGLVVATGTKLFSYKTFSPSKIREEQVIEQPLVKSLTDAGGWRLEVGGWRLDVGCWMLEVVNTTFS